MGVPLAVGHPPNTHRLSVQQALLRPLPAVFTKPCRAVCDFPFGGPVEPLPFDRRVHPEAFFEEGVEVQLAQRLWPLLPFPGEVAAVRPRRQRLLDDEPHQDGEDLQRRLRHKPLPLGDDKALLLFRCWPVLLAVLQPRQRLRQNLVTVAAQRLDVDPVADDGNDPVAAVAGGVLKEFDVVGGEGEAGPPGIGARLVAVGRPAMVDAARQHRLLLLHVGLAPRRHLGAMRDDCPGDAAGEVGRVNSWRRDALAVVIPILRLSDLRLPNHGGRWT
jgi:hypothetical protein